MAVVRVVLILGVIGFGIYKLVQARQFAKAAAEEIRKTPLRPAAAHEWHAPDPAALPPGVVEGTARATTLGGTTLTVFDRRDGAGTHACVRVAMHHLSVPRVAVTASATEIPDAEFADRYVVATDDDAFARELLDERLTEALVAALDLEVLVFEGSSVNVEMSPTTPQPSGTPIALFPRDLLIAPDIERRLAFVAQVLERIPGGIRQQYGTDADASTL